MSAGPLCTQQEWNVSLTIICTTYLVLFNITFIFTPCIISVSGHTNQILCWLDQMTFQEGSVGTLKTNNSHMINILATVLQKCSLAAFQRIIPSMVWQTWALLDFQALFYGVHLYISTSRFTHSSRQRVQKFAPRMCMSMWSGTKRKNSSRSF